MRVVGSGIGEIERGCGMRGRGGKRRGVQEKMKYT